MAPVSSLKPDTLCRKTDPAGLSLDTTLDLTGFDEWPGQDRAIEAVRFGIGIKRAGYNLFALGSTGAGKHTLVRHFIEEKAASEAVPVDWCYVHNFVDPHKPNAINLPAGRGGPFQKDMLQLTEELRVSIPAAFESDDSRARMEALEGEFKERGDKAFGDLQSRAGEKGVGLIRTPLGLALAPVRENEVLGPEEFQKLPEAEQETLRADMEVLQKELQDILRQMPKWETEHRERMRALSREITRFSVAHLIDELRAAYQDIPDVLEHLDVVQEDVVEHANEFIAAKARELGAPGQPGQDPGEATDGAFAKRYHVNLLVDHDTKDGAPVVYEDNPAHGNLIGRIEHVAHMGALLTDFTLIKPGALHRANGGYLILDARKVLMQPFAWEELKRTIKSGEIRIESLGQTLSLVSTVSLEPELIPLDVKIVMTGDRYLYYLLSALDPEFAELFKVAVDIEEDIDRTPEMTPLFVEFLGNLIDRDALRPFNADGVARVLDHAARLAGDSEKLSCHAENISDLLREADYCARQAGEDVVDRAHVQSALDAQIRRADRVRSRTQEAIRRGTILIDVDGEAVGQVNGLSVLQLGGFAFGQPSRITASVQLGKGDVVDIERQVELGGPLHSKGVMILSGFLGQRYAATSPLALKASLVFEQSYGGVDGDSASSAELYALLSALSGAPVKQSLAVTGSVNQHGFVQAIGGVNEKIEGFFDVCRQAGLTGSQGVLIPESNVKHLMLRDDVVEAVRAGRFNVYPIATIDEGIEVLTGMPAGGRNRQGRYPRGTINHLVETRLHELSEAVREFSAKDNGKKSKSKGSAKKGSVRKGAAR
jgi:lon-related putative ATP-dependent protease